MPVGEPGHGIFLANHQGHVQGITECFQLDPRANLVVTLNQIHNKLTSLQAVRCLHSLSRPRISASRQLHPNGVTVYATAAPVAGSGRSVTSFTTPNAGRSMR